MLNIHDAMATPESAVSLHVGNLVNWFLYGVLTVQLYLYYVAFPNDRVVYTVIVYAVYFLETVHSIGLAAGLSIMMLDMNSNAVIITVILLTVVGGITALVTQCLYAFRIRVITDMQVIPLIIVLLAVAQMGMAIATLVSMPVSLIYIWIGLKVINDILIAVVMVQALSNHISLSQYKDRRLIRIIHLIVETGCASATVNILSLIFLSLTGFIGDVYTAPLIILSKIYANSIMLLLNNRMTIVGSRNMPPPVKTIEVIRQIETSQSDTITSSFVPNRRYQNI